MMDEQPNYPEAEKWTDWHVGWVAINQFIDWLGYKKGIQLAQQVEQECYKCKRKKEIIHKNGAPWIIECPNCEGTGKDFTEYMYPIMSRLIKLYYEYAEIDEDKLEAERRAMLDKMREMNTEREGVEDE